MSNDSRLLGGEFYYVDDDGRIQGPFAAARMAKWFRKGYLRSQLLLRCRRDGQGREEPCTPLSAAAAAADADDLGERSIHSGEALSEGAAVALAERQARARENGALAAVLPGEWVTLRYAVAVVHGRGGEYACPFVAKKEKEAGAKMGEAVLPRPNNGEGGAAAGRYGGAHSRTEQAAQATQAVLPRSNKGEGGAAAGRDGGAHSRTPTQDLARRLLVRSSVGTKESSMQSSTRSDASSVDLLEGGGGGAGGGGGGGVGGDGSTLNHGDLDLKSIREKITHDAETQLRSRILQEQLRIALCKLELESLHAVRQSLSGDNSAITQMLSLEEEEGEGEGEGGEKKSRIMGATDLAMSMRTEVLDGRIRSFQGMCSEVSQLEARSKQIAAAMKVEDAKRAPTVE
jgi:hypothetical protein